VESEQREKLERLARYVMRPAVAVGHPVRDRVTDEVVWRSLIVSELCT